MGFFNKVKTQASNIGGSISKSTSKVTGDIITSSKENAKLVAIQGEINSLNGDLEVAYNEIGKKYVEYLSNGGEALEFGVADTLKHVENKLEKRENLENELIKIEKELKDQLILQEKALYQKEFDEEKAKLDKALKMDIISESEYSEKISKSKSKLDNFEEIRKIEKQYEMDLISEEEKNLKIANLIS